MKRGRSTNAPTKAQAARHDAIRETGCVVARILALGFVPCELHHLTLGSRHGQKRIGHDHVVGLNPYSHRGVPFGGLTLDQCRAMFGPSYAREPREFRRLYPDDQLIARQRELLGMENAA